MRLAAMTASKEDVEELSKTFKMVRPSMEEINSAAAQAPVFTRRTIDNTRPVEAERSAKGGGLILIAIVILILIGLISALFF